MKKIVKCILIPATVALMCGCGKNETEMPYGTYISAEYGSIVFDKEGISLSDVDDGLLLDVYVSGKLGQKYFEELNEGVKINSEESGEYKQELENEFDIDRCKADKYSYEWEKDESDYTVYFSIKNKSYDEYEYDYFRVWHSDSYGGIA